MGYWIYQMLSSCQHLGWNNPKLICLICRLATLKKLCLSRRFPNKTCIKQKLPSLQVAPNPQKAGKLPFYTHFANTKMTQIFKKKSQLPSLLIPSSSYCISAFWLSFQLPSLDVNCRQVGAAKSHPATWSFANHYKPIWIIWYCININKCQCSNSEW